MAVIFSVAVCMSWLCYNILSLSYVSRGSWVLLPLLLYCLMINAINGVHYGLKSRIRLFAHCITLSCYHHNTDLPEGIEYACQIYSLERVSIIFRFGQRSQIFYTAPIGWKFWWEFSVCKSYFGCWRGIGQRKSLNRWVGGGHSSMHMAQTVAAGAKGKIRTHIKCLNSIVCTRSKINPWCKWLSKLVLCWCSWDTRTCNTVKYHTFGQSTQDMFPPMALPLDLRSMYVSITIKLFDKSTMIIS